MVGTVQKIILGAADRASRNKCGDLHQLSQPQGKKSSLYQEIVVWDGVT